PTVTNSLQTEKPAPQIETETDKQRPANISTMSKQQPPSQQTFTPTQMETLERSLSGFYQHQNETLQVHRQYLDQQSEYSRTVYQLMQQQIELASQGTQIPAAVDQQMQMFHAHQGETLRVHEQYLHQQSEQTQSALSITHQQLGNSGSAPETVQTSAPVVQISAPAAAPTPAVVKPVPAPTPVQTVQVQVVPASTVSTPDPVVQAPTVSQGTTSTVSAERITQVTLAVVSEKTGYPQEMLELGMDMESDLGIDSIKRVEILGSVQDQVPQLPEVPGDELAEMRTLGEIVEHLQSKLGTPSSSAPQTAPAQSEVQDTPVSSSVSGNSAADVTSVMLAIVSENTGYPQEMLELSMDMESDLGIDSIKRVEILGSVQDQVPQLPEVPGDELAEMRTLGQIVEHLKSKMGDDVSTVESPVAEVVATPKSSGTIGVDPTPVFMSIISEKTGYPSEMLELSMDMEADLGIDSIKRVEIMWALQEQYQNLPQISANDIAELRTVGQIIEHVKTILPVVGEVAIPELDLVENSASTATSADSSGNGNGSAAADLGSAPGEIAPALLSIIGEKTGYPVEMLELSMDMEADLGIDSIKRVEIMWSLQEQLPHLPQVSGSEIGELRTLKEIVDHLGSLAPAETSGVAIIPAPVSDSTEPVKKNS
ncbi:MAG: phosphopantetheine-binding protein, partial [SAR324 cluster bacterium]|nr:phosphopantetheine-binding protein [SAR324 cluster bacterium]